MISARLSTRDGVIPAVISVSGSRKWRAKESSNALVRYLGSLKWVPIPVSVGFAYIAYQQYGHVVKRERRLLNENEPANLVAKDWQVKS